jgi:hypothetical protein
MRAAIAAAVLVFVCAGPAAAVPDPPPKGNNTGCCLSFDDSPVNAVFCFVPGACVFTGPPK